MEYKNFTLYKPAESIGGIFYLKSDDDVDWYEAQKKFSAETLKIAYDSTGRICIADTDASAIWPINSSISEISSENVPDDFSTNGKWFWNGETIINAVTIVTAKKNKMEDIKNRRDEITADYIIINDHHFHSDTSSRIQQISLTKMGKEKQIPPGLMWKTKNNGLIELTNEIAAQFESVTMDHDMRLFANAQRHIAAVEALDDIQAVLDYDYSTGWQP
ncbi:MULTISPECIES: DUF4376 domain-containing protein [Escherichia]|uniref:DUF4376 domain-containing protein n=1 Tax=Escherichia TaxID=561 RepID=UPI0007E37617|nr:MULTISPECIES: DUF4376 domain-containing protein [Escherichia]MEB7937387.1 DUF4376 domain-containing protein [Escherichia whittamii]MEC9498135.1 DUF4376 domain-containing protein [Escherichia whittamii]MEC9558620.1 DUF4376 domain-containing protein [Escherichia whittamii]QLX42771.1 DUF4376 domain-containing protein [Escherichia coli]